MKYLLKIALLSTLIMLTIACNKDTEQDIATQESEARTSGLEFFTLADQGNETSFRKPNPEQIIKFLDSDKDGKISGTEAEQAKRKRLAENFDFIDSNKDGFIDYEELEKLSTMIRSARKGMLNPELILKFLDTDKDGKINRTEAEKAKRKTLAKNFDKIDINMDGFIDEEELMSLSNYKK